MSRRLSSSVWGALALGWAILIWQLMTAADVAAVPLLARWLPSSVVPFEDKIGHLGLFGVQTGLLQRALDARLQPWRSLLVALILAVALGGATELRQRSIPTRDADVADFVADALGALAYGAALAISEAVRRPRPGRPRAR